MFVDTIQSLSDGLAERGYHILLHVSSYTPQAEAELVVTLPSRRPDGVVFIGVHHTAELKKVILNAVIPIVEIWDLTPAPIDMLVDFSHEKVGQAMADYLLEKGYQRSGLLWTVDYRASQRKRGLYDALSRHGIAADTQVDVPFPVSLALEHAGLTQPLADHEFDVTACSSGTLVQGAIMEAESRGIRMPQELAVIGFGDLGSATNSRSAITTVSVDRRVTGQYTASLLADRIEKIPREDGIIDIGFHLVGRESA